MSSLAGEPLLRETMLGSSVLICALAIDTLAAHNWSLATGQVDAFFQPFPCVQLAGGTADPA